MTFTADPAVLVLEDGTRYTGRAYGARGRTLGEVVFATGMTGYQETLTDPSYAGQIVVMTAPHIGNTGVNDEDPESSRIWVSGYVVRDPSRVVSNYRADGSLDDQLVRDGIVGISGIDTRAVTRRLRDAGAMRGGVFSGPDAALSPDEQLAIVRAGEQMSGRNLSAEVSTTDGYVVPATAERIGNLAVLDLGVKTSTLNYLAARGFDVHVLPQSVDARRGARDRAGRRVLLERPGRPRRIRPPRRTAAGHPAGRRAVLRHLLRQPAARPRPRLRHLQAAVRPPRHQPAGGRKSRPVASRSRATTTASRSMPRSARSRTPRRASAASR